MIIIKLWCLESQHDPESLNELRKQVIEAVLQVSELKLEEQDQIVVMLPDPMLKGEPDTFLEIFGEFKYNPNDSIVLAQLTEKVTNVLSRFYTSDDLMTCTSAIFDPQKAPKKNLQGIFLN